MSWTEKKRRWERYVEREMQEIQDLLASTDHVSYTEVDDRLAELVRLGLRGVHLHDGGGKRYQADIERKLHQIELAMAELRSFAKRRSLLVSDLRHFRSPWRPVAPGESPIPNIIIEDFRKKLGLEEPNDS